MRAANRSFLLLLVVLFVALFTGCGAQTAQEEDEEIAVASTTEEALVVRDSEAQFFRLMNHARISHGLKRLQMQPGLVRIARAWSRHMDDANTLSHRKNLVARVEDSVTMKWTRIGENVGVGADVESLHKAFMHSDEHRHNVLGHYDYVGIGVHESDGAIWVTFDFLESSANLPTVAP